MPGLLRRTYSAVMARYYGFKRVGRGLSLAGLSYVRRGTVSLGDHVFINRGCYLSGDIEIGHFVMLASGVAIVGGDHVMHDPSRPMIHAGRAENLPVVIGDDAWLGHGAIVLHGVRVGQGAVVAAGSVVTRDVPDYAIVAGNPARVLRPRLDGEDRRRHEAMLEEYRRTGRRTWVSPAPSK